MRVEERIAEGTTAISAPSEGPPRFLLLDDDPDDRLTAIRLLQQEFPDAATDEVFDRDAFDRALAGGPYTAAITDYQMRWTDGIQALREIKGRWPGCPVIVFTASGNEEVAVEAMKAGADDYVIKTVKGLARLPLAVRNAIGRAHARQRLAEVEDDLRAQAAALREEHRGKDEFLAMLAHELRNPLSPIRNAAHLIRLKAEEMDEPAIQAACGVIERQVEALSRMVDDLLDVARVSRGTIELRPETIDIGVAIGQAVEVARPLIEAKGHRLDVQLPPEPIHVKGDLTRLTQVFANLLTNAAKFTQEGGRIAISAAREDTAVVRVSDTGVGISPGLLPQVFDLFAQGDRSLDRSQGGLGIGLTLAKRLVELQGGSVTAHSEGENQGSELTVRLPVSEAPERGSEAAPEPDVEPGERARILVVDDNRDAAESLAALLDLLGHETRIAYDGPTALQIARELQPTLVLLDIGLPEMNGYEVARALRSEPHGERITIVALSGYGRESDKELSRQAGFDDHLVKPVAIDALQRLLGGPGDRRLARADPTRPG